MLFIVSPCNESVHCHSRQVLALSSIMISVMYRMSHRCTGSDGLVGLNGCWRAVLQAAMEADRKLREQQYAARREKDWEETIRREAELHR